MTPEPRFILLVEDHQKIRANTTWQLREEGFAVQAAESPEAALEMMALQPEPPDLLLLDVRFPGTEGIVLNGIDLIKRLQDEKRLPPTIIISGEASMSETLEAVRLGVYDFIEKPFTRERLMQSVRNCLEHASLKRELSVLQTRISEEHTILGNSPVVVRLRERIERVGPSNARVLIRGESGTGKELAANLLHRLSSRRDRPLVKINCAAIPAQLVEDELFGHARGAFTDAKNPKPGLFEEAQRGTLFLDEIGDMELPLQARLLRVLEDGKVRRIGETHDRQIDVRVIAATNKNLEAMTRDGRFREDLYFRLAAVPIDIAPLRQRPEDIAILVRHYLDLFCAEDRRRRLTLEPEALARLERYPWPGNIRELRNVCEQVALFATDPVSVDQLPLSTSLDRAVHESGILRLVETAPILPLRDFKEQCEREYIESVLRRTNWHFVHAARLLDIQRTYLHQKIAALEIPKPR
ncbi:MAG: Fis family transcriptional regulator, partial [Acidobacteria bacterium]|nr:Fis family transcriptional regulator [Acidobacteriota bacterium]